MNGIYGFGLASVLALLSACNYGLVDHDRPADQADTAPEVDSGGSVEVEVVEDTGSGSSAGSDDTSNPYICYPDNDGDGYGNGDWPYGFEGSGCSDGWVSNGDDCDDGDDNVHPGATETNNDVDDDCDGTTDEGFDAPDDTTDVDDDKDGWTVADGDCDDGYEYTNPDELEWCGDDEDNDCDGEVDEGCDDADDDGFIASDDCDDNDDDINPDADEVCGNSTDENCDGVAEACKEIVDADGDGYDEDEDCDDSDSTVHEDCEEEPTTYTITVKISNVYEEVDAAVFYWETETLYDAWYTDSDIDNVSGSEDMLLWWEDGDGNVYVDIEVDMDNDWVRFGGMVEFKDGSEDWLVDSTGEWADISIDGTYCDPVSNGTAYGRDLECEL